MENQDLRYLLIDAGVRHWEDATVNGKEDEAGDLIPCRHGERWQPKIDIQNSKITNWEKGKAASIYYKVCDDGEYFLTDSTGNKIMRARGYYIPECLCSDGDCDYISMNINEDGVVSGFSIDIDEFEAVGE